MQIKVSTSMVIMQICKNHRSHREHDRPAPNKIDPPSASSNNEAKEIYSVLLDKATKYIKIYNDEMNFKERLWSTKARNIPTVKDQKICNEVTERLVFLLASKPEVLPVENCAN